MLITNLTPGVTITFEAVYKNIGRRHRRDVQCETNHRDPELAVTTRESRSYLADCVSARWLASSAARAVAA